MTIPIVVPYPKVGAAEHTMRGRFGVDEQRLNIQLNKVAIHRCFPLVQQAPLLS
jgi:hypothetical protein